MNRKTVSVVLITIASIFLNVSGKFFTVHFNLPMWLDSFGTLISAYMLGPVSGAITGAASNVILGFSDPKTMIFVIISISIGASAGYYARKGIFNTFFQAMTYASLLAVFTTIASFILDIILMSQETGNVWGNAVIRFFTKIGLNKYIACFIGQFYLEFVDKVVTVAVFYFVIRVLHLIRKKGLKKVSVMSLVLLFILPVLSGGLQAKASDKNDFSSIQTVFNESDGLTPGHATSLTTTFDGMLWVGTYAGLYSYNGRVFTHFNSPEIKNVNCLYTDTEGRLWVGTNDNGLAIIINNELVNVVNTDSGLCSDSVRSIVQASDGTIYAGTSEYMQTISISNGISVTGNIKKLKYVHGTSGSGDGLVAAVTGDNSLYLVRSGRITDSVKASDSKDYSAVTFYKGKLYTGTSAGNIVVFSVKNEKLHEKRTINSGIESVVNQVIVEKSGSCIVVCDNGLYRVKKNGSRRKISKGDFSFSLQKAIYDYQKNLWVASSRQGLLEISPSAYTDLFTTYNKKSRIVNAVMVDGDRFYTGCDDGLYIVDRKTGSSVENDLTRKLEGSRIRALAKDREGNIYAASYSEGLVMADKNGELKVFSGKKSQGHKARCVIVNHDDTVISSGDHGICFIKNGKIQALIPYGEDLGNVTVLSLCELPDGSIIATTDGNGYFCLKDQKIVKHFSKKDGLGSDVVLKAVASEKADTYFLVTSNGLSVCEKGSLRKLGDFPYSNNYDILEDKSGRVYVTGSAGIYITTEKDLLENDGENAFLSGSPEGLPYNLTVNSQNMCDGDYLYLCGSSGIIRADAERLSDISSSIRFFVNKVSAGDIDYQASDDYDVTIPGDSGKITVTPEIINFAKPDPVIKYRLKGYEKDWHSMNLKSVPEISYSGLKAGKYTFVMDIRDRAGKTVEENSFSFSISEKLFERGYFKVYLVLVLLAFIGWISWFFTHLFFARKQRKTEAALEMARKQLQMGNESVLAMAKALFSKDRRTGEHCHRVAYYAEHLGRAYGFSEKETKNLKKAALLHDIGKIAIPDAVLNKPAKLTDEEYAIMKTHTTAGAEILKGFTIVEHVSEGARYHHERYDGKGYPEGISGENIPLYGRIIAVCDTFDAMTANRVYRGALDMEQVMGELEQGRGTQFDPHLDDLFMNLVEKGEISPQKTFEMFKSRDLTEDIE